MALRKKILIAMVSIIFFISLLIGVSAFDLTSNVVHSFESEIVELTANNVAVQMVEIFSNARNVITQMVEETKAHEMAEHSNLSPVQIENDSLLLQSRVYDFLSVSQLTGNGVFHFINMYLENGVNACTSMPNNLPYDNFEEVCSYLEKDRILSADEYKNMVWFDVVEIKNAQGIRAECFLCVRFLYDRVTMERIGAIVAGVETQKLWQMYKSVFPEAIVVNTWGDIVVGGKQFDTDNTFLENLSQALSTWKYPERKISIDLEEENQQALCWQVANGYAFFIVPLKKFAFLESKATLQFFVKIAIVIASAIIVTILASVFFSKSVTDGLKKLKDTAQRVADGERNIRFLPKKHDEVAYVGLQFNHMLDQIEKYYTDLQLSEREKTDLELSLLHAKINPHLLYNSLDIVAWAIKRDDRQRAEKIVYALSDFFKRSLAKGREYTTLEECVELIRSYLELQCLASRKNYSLQVSIPPVLLEYELLHLLLQPVVENSVVHGFAAFRDDGTIRISAKIVAECVEIHVQDDGIGISPDQVQSINRYLNEDLYVENRMHYGLSNVVRRIKAYYGQEYGMEISSEMGEYTDTLIRIPYAKGQGDKVCSN